MSLEELQERSWHFAWDEHWALNTDLGDGIRAVQNLAPGKSQACYGAKYPSRYASVFNGKTIITEGRDSLLRIRAVIRALQYAESL